MNDTIYALATAPGRAALAVMRLTGPNCDSVLATLTGRPLPPVRSMRVRHIHDSGGVAVDESLVVRFKGPGSFTGEDMVELHLHGGVAVVSAVAMALKDAGCRSAAPGEFTRRAFENGRLSLAEAEGVADLIDAETDQQRTQALDQLGGALDARFSRWKSALVGVLVLLEAAIDFPDEDLPGDVSAGARAALEELDRDLEAALGSARGEQVRSGYRVALIGLPNAGKSSLFNKLIGRDAAIVTAVPGTTRDVIEADLILEGYLVRLADTAGFRETFDAIEIEGIRRARAWAEGAALRLWLADQTLHVEHLPIPGPDDWWVLTHADLAGPDTGHAANPYCFSLDARSDDGVGPLTKALGRHVSGRLSSGDFPAVTRTRHREIIVECRKALGRAIDSFGRPAELVGEDVRLAARALERLSGRIGSEEVLDLVFKSFCIGK
jgi:tRNA modification GTPase